MAEKGEIEPGEFEDIDLGEKAKEKREPTPEEMIQETSLREQAADVKEDRVKLLPGAKAPKGAAPQDLSGTGFTYRCDWGNKCHDWKLTLNWGAINCNSRVFVSAHEFGGGDQCAFVGGARYTVHNVAPGNGFVTVWITIEWDSNIRVRLDYLVINP
jgi:hypothetical protein